MIKSANIFQNTFLLLSITDGDESRDQYLNNVSLHPVDITQAEFKELSKNSSKFQSQFLENYREKRNITHDCLISALK